MSQQKLLWILSALKKRSRPLLRISLFFIPTSIMKFILKWLGAYPRIVGNEIFEVKKVLLSPHWNTSSGGANKHKELESAFADFTGSKFAVAVGSGGIGILMAFRALGLKPGSVIAHQVDTCNAVPQALLNAHYTPYFLDSSIENYMLDFEKLKNPSSKSFSGILSTHLWGYPEEIQKLSVISKSRNIPFIEDCCLALGLTIDGTHVGNFGMAGIFSFGATKPLQVGEGGMITTNDEAFANELRSMRNWGERVNSRNLDHLGLNGRFSEISSAVAIEQLYGYRYRMRIIRELMADFQRIIGRYELFDSTRSNLNSELINPPIRLVVRLSDEYAKKPDIVKKCLGKFRDSGIGAFTINFEPLNKQSFFASGSWREWTHDVSDEIVWNNAKDFEGATFIHNQLGFSLPQSDFASRSSYRDMVKRFQKAVEEIY
jgi:dTDP-4-amino-4,6-dideoxygalactose transaminase